MVNENWPAYCTADVLVLGCGNMLVGDDGFGPAVAELLIAQKLPDGILVINAQTGSRGIIFNLVTGECRPKALIIIDALDTSGWETGKRKKPGELFWTPLESLSLEKAEDFSLHMTPASNMLLVLKKLGMDIRILACQPGPLPGMIYEGLSEAVKGAVPKAAEMVLGAARLVKGQ